MKDQDFIQIILVFPIITLVTWVIMGFKTEPTLEASVIMLTFIDTLYLLPKIKKMIFPEKESEAKK